MFKIKIIEWNRFNGCTVDHAKWTFINGKRVKNDDYFRLYNFDQWSGKRLEYENSKCYTEKKSPNIWKDITEIYYKVIDK